MFLPVLLVSAGFHSALENLKIKKFEIGALSKSSLNSFCFGGGGQGKGKRGKKNLEEALLRSREDFGEAYRPYY